MHKMKQPTPTAGANNNTTSGTPPPNFRRKRRHSEPHLSVTKPYKNFVTHWKLDTKKPTATTNQTPPSTVLAQSTSPSPLRSASPSEKSGGAGSWSPQTSEVMKSMFHPHKKDQSNNNTSNNNVITHPTPSRAGQSQHNAQWARRSSLPHIYDSPSNTIPSSGLYQSVIMEEDIEPIKFPPAHNEYRFPSIALHFPPPPQDPILFRNREDLAPFQNHSDSSHGGDEAPSEASLPSLRTLLENVQDVSLDENDVPPPDDIQPTRNYVVRRRMSIDSLLE